jgi:hypothetical protein
MRHHIMRTRIAPHRTIINANLPTKLHNNPHRLYPNTATPTRAPIPRNHIPSIANHDRRRNRHLHRPSNTNKSQQRPARNTVVNTRRNTANNGRHLHSITGRRTTVWRNIHGECGVIRDMHRRCAS